MREQRGEKRLQRNVSLLCGCVFAIFCFTFIAIYQSPLLEALYDKVATGKLNYNGYVVATIATTILLLLSWWMNRVARFQREWTAMSYLPATLILAFITDIDETIYTGKRDYLSWTIIMLVGLFIYASLAFLLQRILFAKIKNPQMEGNRIVWRNLFLFAIMFVLAGWFSNGNENLKYEATAYSHYKRGDVEGALNVASRSLNASRELTAARAFYLSQKGSLGDKLFCYPQYYGAEGLLPSLVQQSPLSPDSVYSALEAKRNDGERAMEYLYRVANNDSVSKIAADYYLCGLLLDKRLSEFIESLPRYYDLKQGVSLPLHYKEALILYATAISDVKLSFNSDTLRAELSSMGLLNWKKGDKLPAHYIEAFKHFAISSDELAAILELDTLGNNFADVLDIERQYPDLMIRSNFVKKQFGHTYWWYYSYSN